MILGGTKTYIKDYKLLLTVNRKCSAFRLKACTLWDSYRQFRVEGLPTEKFSAMGGWVGEDYLRGLGFLFELVECMVLEQGGADDDYERPPMPPYVAHPACGQREGCTTRLCWRASCA